jgi:hypothetical protein
MLAVMAVVMAVVMMAMVLLAMTIKRMVLVSTPQAHRVVLCLRITVKERILLEVMCCRIRRLPHDQRRRIYHQYCRLGGALPVDI